MWLLTMSQVWLPSRRQISFFGRIHTSWAYGQGHRYEGMYYLWPWEQLIPMDRHRPAQSQTVVDTLPASDVCLWWAQSKKKQTSKAILCRMGSRQRATSSPLLCLIWSIPGSDAGETPGINELWSWSLGRLWSLAGPLMNLGSRVLLMSLHLFERENATASKDMVRFERYHRRFYPSLAPHACTKCLVRMWQRG